MAGQGTEESLAAWQFPYNEQEAWNQPLQHHRQQAQERQSLVPESPLLVAFVVFVALITFNAGQMLLAGTPTTTTTTTVTTAKISPLVTRAVTAATDPITWSFGMEQAERCVAPGSSVTFTWSGTNHNVVEVEKKQLKPKKCVGMFSSYVGKAGPHVWKAPALEKDWVPEVHYLACGVGKHCGLGNMRAKIKVSKSC